MDTTFTALVCYLLTLSLAMGQERNLTTTSLPGLNQTNTSTPFNSTEEVATTSNMTTNATTYSTTAPTESTNNHSTPQPTTIMTPSTSITSATATTDSSHTTTPTVVTTPAIQTTDSHMSTSDTTVVTTAHSSPPVSTTADSNDITTQAFLLDASEKNMTIIFSVVLGTAALALVMFTFHKYKHKIQFAHQRLENDRGSFVADDDTLVISGGLYDGHPIYDNVPPVSTDQSQFRLEFLP